MTPADLRNQFQKETGESPNIATYAYWLEQRLLASSEAEKGETAGFPESARRIAVALLTEVMNGMNESLQERITLFLQSQKVFFPSPPSPQEKQGAEVSSKIDAKRLLETLLQYEAKMNEEIISLVKQNQ